MHEKSTFDPKLYRYVGVMFQGSCGPENEEYACAIEGYFEQDAPEAVEAAEALLRDNPAPGRHSERGTCDHCGARFSFGVVYKYLPTGQGIAVGHTCAAQDFGYSSRAEFDLGQLRDKVAARREYLKKVSVAHKFAEAAGIVEALELDHYLIRDIKGKLVHYGTISDKQVALVKKLEAESKAKGPAVPVLVGKDVTITGTVRSLKSVDGFRRGVEVTKMLVEDDRGFKVYGTAPAVLLENVFAVDKRNLEHEARGEALEDVPLKGKRVEFAASVEASRSDPSFGLFKRPRKARVIG
jgi:hypothetical protein